MSEEFKNGLFEVNSEKAFNDKAIKIFGYQAENNPVYRDYLSFLGKKPESIKDIFDIPFLPIGFFRNHKIVTGEQEPQIIFKSSGTTGMEPGNHYVSDMGLYEQSCLKGFNMFYGYPSDYCILALLPSYLEREGSSLIYMMESLIKKSKYLESGFYLKNFVDLIAMIDRLKEKKRKIFLIGVSFALLDLAEKHSPDFSGIIVMETGGMKGMRKELVREELHDILCRSFNVSVVHSEYGMTELLSQAYSSGNGLFYCPPWMKVILRDPDDPLTNFTETQSTGGINIIDFANINSCCFIATSDLGRLNRDGSFEVLGRFDNSDIRGCNLLV
jgi:phenylacetate-coenzyme A ligase PaaK-like adenylate-forming protein